MHIFKSKNLPLLFAFAALLWTCSKKETNSDPSPNNSATDRGVLLTHIADSLIIPGYEIFKSKFDIFLTKSEAFRTNPTQTSLSEFRQAWVDAYIEWQRVELFDVGPAEAQVLRSFFNIYPASEQGINANITATSVNLELPAAYPQQGFPAVDYLINGLGSSDAAILAYYTTASDAANRIAYLKLVTDQMNTKFTKVYTAWNTDYRATFISKTTTSASSSLSLLVNGYVLNYERYIRAGKFGIPSGVMSGGTAFPEKVEAYYKKDISATLAKTANQASADLFNGKSRKAGVEGPSFKTYLDALSAKDSKTGTALTETVNAQFVIVSTKLSALPENLSQEATTNKQALVDVYTDMQKAVRMLKVDMTSAMSITITYTDNDGD